MEYGNHHGNGRPPVRAPTRLGQAASSCEASISQRGDRRLPRPMEELLDSKLLAVWLNFANGSIEYADLITKLTTAESARLGGSTDEELEAQKDILETINLMDE